MKISSKRIKVILPASEIADGQCVFKITGTKPYTLKKKLIIYGNNETKYPEGNKKTIESSVGICFLIDGFGNITAIKDDLDVMIDVEIDVLMDMLYENEDDYDPQ